METSAYSQDEHSSRIPLVNGYNHESGEHQPPPDAPPEIPPSRLYRTPPFGNIDPTPSPHSFRALPETGSQYGFFPEPDEPPDNFYEAKILKFVKPEPPLFDRGPLDEGIKKRVTYRISAIGSEGNPLFFEGGVMENIQFNFPANSTTHVTFKNVDWRNVNPVSLTKSIRVGGNSTNVTSKLESQKIVEELGGEVHPLIFNRIAFYDCEIDCNHKRVIFIDCIFYKGVKIRNTAYLTILNPVILDDASPLDRRMTLNVPFFVVINQTPIMGKLRVDYTVETPLSRARQLLAQTVDRLRTHASKA